MRKSQTRSFSGKFEVERREFARKEFALVESVQELSSRAALYDKAFAENRHLHNAIQDLKGSIRVFCRVRPHLPGADGGERDVVEVSGDAVADLENAASQGIAVRTFDKRGVPERKAFSFDRVFGPDATQGGIYEECSALIRCACDGYNVCFMAYGQTGSGKTYTMSGPSGAESGNDSRGINYRALDDLFDLIKERRATHAYEVSVSVLEIYNEQCRDLLAAIGGHKVEILPTKKAGFNVPGAVTRAVRSRRDVAEVMLEGEVNRATGATAMNERSSRSHSAVIVHVEGVTKDSGARTRGVLYLVDLAGSERVSRSEATGDRLKEAQHINKSLSALGDVVSALQQRSPHVPYRNSKLTSLLQGALGRSGKALIFMHVSPAEGSASETVSTLNFAARVASVELGRAAKNAETSEMANARVAVAKLEDAVAAAEEERDRLKRELDEERAASRGAARAVADAERRAADATRRAKDAERREAAGGSARGADREREERTPTPLANPAAGRGLRLRRRRRLRRRSRRREANRRRVAHAGFERSVGGVGVRVEPGRVGSTVHRARVVWDPQASVQLRLPPARRRPPPPPPPLADAEPREHRQRHRAIDRFGNLRASAVAGDDGQLLGGGCVGGFVPLRGHRRRRFHPGRRGGRRRRHLRPIRVDDGVGREEQVLAVREDREGRRGPSQGRRRQADSRRRRFLERQPV